MVDCAIGDAKGATIGSHGVKREKDRPAHKWQIWGDTRKGQKVKDKDRQTMDYRH